MHGSVGSLLMMVIVIANSKFPQCPQTGASIGEAMMHIAYSHILPKIMNSPYFREIYKCSPTCVQFKAFCLVCFFAFPLFLPWCDYASWM